VLTIKKFIHKKPKILKKQKKHKVNLLLDNINSS